MIEIKIVTNNADELRIMGVALLELAKLTDGEEVIIPDHAVTDKEIPDSLKVQNPVEPKQEPKAEEPVSNLDADGYPWDKRIHSTAHSQNGDGTWKYLRRPKKFGEDDIAWKIEIKRVEALLRGENPEQQDDPATVFGGGGVKTENPGADMQQEPVLTQEETQALTETATATNQETETPVNFAMVMKYVTGHMDIVPINEVSKICNKYGVNDLAALQNDDSMIVHIFNDLKAIVAGAQ